MTTLTLKGYQIALIEVAILMIAAFFIREYVTAFQWVVSPVTYYWFCFTVLTGFWELTFVLNYNKVADRAATLVKDSKSVWFTEYPFYYILPNYMAQIFYAEYGAHADREYMDKKDIWSRLIESSHAFVCGAFSLCALVLVLLDDYDKAHNAAMVAMGGQFMNSVLYMGNYAIQCRTPTSVNFNRTDFPVGKWMSKRWFMWVNIFWMLFPSIIIIQTLLPLSLSIGTQHIDTYFILR
jgi:hypothetical protein